MPERIGREQLGCTVEGHLLGTPRLAGGVGRLGAEPDDIAGPELAEAGHLGAGDFFGEIALIAERERTATITALSTCKLLVLQKRDFERFMSAHPDLKEAVRVAAKVARTSQ